MSTTKSITFEKKNASELAKTNPRTQCYRCKGYAHFANQYPSQTKIVLVEVLIEDVEEKDGMEVIIHRQDDDLDASANEHEFNGCVGTLASTDLTLCYDIAHLRGVRYISAQHEQVNGWRRTTTFHMFTSIGDKNCKVIVDTESSINIVSSKVTEGLD